MLLKLRSESPISRYILITRSALLLFESFFCFPILLDTRTFSTTHFFFFMFLCHRMYIDWAASWNRTVCTIRDDRFACIMFSLCLMWIAAIELFSSTNEYSFWTVDAKSNKQLSNRSACLLKFREPDCLFTQSPCRRKWNIAVNMNIHAVWIYSISVFIFVEEKSVTNAALNIQQIKWTGARGISHSISK